MPRSEATVAIVQARASSSRFPGKVLADVEGVPLLARVLRRLLRSTECVRFAVATSTSPDDDAVVRLGEAEGVEVVRGPLEDVLERYRHAAEATHADAIVRLTGDCPLLDAAVVDRVVRAFAESGADYASNVHPPTFPDGLDVEVISRSALERAAREARRPSDREHVTLYVATHGHLFSHASVSTEPDLSGMRWTVDYPDDLVFVRAVFRRFRGREDVFGALDVLRMLEVDEELRRLMPTHVRNEGLARSLAAETDDVV
jgi:spore coat polysaccharide biosynthesis protein SpsF (cytidylyltransferase family)